MTVLYIEKEVETVKEIKPKRQDIILT